MPKCHKCNSIFGPGLLCAQGFCAECRPCVCTAIDCRNCRAGSSRASTRMLSDAPMEEVIEAVPIGIATLKYLATFQCDRPNTCCPDNLCNSCWTRKWAQELLDQRDLLKSGRGVGGKPIRGRTKDCATYDDFLSCADSPEFSIEEAKKRSFKLMMDMMDPAESESKTAVTEAVVDKDGKFVVKQQHVIDTSTPSSTVGLELPGRPYVAEHDFKCYADALKAELLAQFDARTKERMREISGYRLEVETARNRREHAWEVALSKARAVPRTPPGSVQVESLDIDPLPGRSVRTSFPLDTSSFPSGVIPPECDPAYGEEPPPETEEDRLAYDMMLDKLESSGAFDVPTKAPVDTVEKPLSDADAGQLAADILQDQFEKHGHNARTEAAITAMKIAYGSEEEKVDDKTESVAADQLRCDIYFQSKARMAALDAIDAAEMQKTHDTMYGVKSADTGTVPRHVATEIVEHPQIPGMYIEQTCDAVGHRYERRIGRRVKSAICSACGRPLSEHHEGKEEGTTECPDPKP